MKTHFTPDELAAARREQLARQQIKDQAFEAYALQVICEQTELMLGQKEWKSHDLMNQTDWNSVRDRIFYILSEMRPTEEEYREAMRVLYDRNYD